MLANNKEFFFQLLKEHIQGTYGFLRQDEEEYQQKYRDGLLTDQEVQDHNCPGPFSFHSYLMALLSPEDVGRRASFMPMLRVVAYWAHRGICRDIHMD